MMGMSQFEKRYEAILSKKNRKDNIHIKITDERHEIYSIGQTHNYIPSKTGSLFHSDNSFVRLVMGPYGSGKSTMCINEIVRRANAMPIWSNGRRKSRWAIVRNTSGELQSTTLQTWLQWFGDLGDVSKRQKPIMTYEHAYNDGNGIVELELIFMALDRPDDVRKIKSLELTGCYINELSEVPQAALSHMKGRVNRYPSHGLGHPPYWAGIIADTNPPDEDHWIHKDFEDKNLESYKLFKQPPGLIKDENKIWVHNPIADNIQNLPNDYYTKLAEGQTEEFVKVFCLGQYGSVGTGKRVFPEFNSDLHAKASLDAIQGDPIYLGWDFGLTPACVVMQLTAKGQLLILKEYVGDGVGIRSFAESYVIPKLAIDFPYNKVGMSVGDPAGNSRNEIMEELSCIGELNNLGVKTIAARTNDIDPRLSATRFFLNKMCDGKPSFQIDKSKCPTLYKGFVKDYIFQRMAVSGEERFRDKPHKNMASHPMDALGYMCLELASDRIVKEKGTEKILDIWNPVERIFN